MDSRIEQAKKETDLPELIKQEVQLRWNGRSHVGCCPFHGERTPSFHVKDNRYHCFGCGAKGDAIDWCMNKLGMDFKSAIDYLVGAETPTQYQPSGFTKDPGSFEDRVKECKRKLPGSLLVRAILEPRIPQALRAYAHIGVHPVAGIDELELISKVFGLGGDALGQYEALKIWEDMISQRWIPY